MKRMLLWCLGLPLLVQAQTEDIKCYVTLEGGMQMVLQQPVVDSKRPAKAVLTGETGYSAGRATRQGSSSLTRFTGQSAITFSTCRR